MQMSGPRGFSEAAQVYDVAGVPKRCRLSTGEGGHRYYKKDVWPFVKQAFSE